MDQQQRDNVLSERRETLPTGAGLAGLRDLHIYDVYEIMGVRVDAIGLIMGVFISLMILPLLLGIGLPWWVALPLNLGMFLGFVKKRARAAGDGLFVKAGDLRHRFDLEIGQRVKAKTGKVSHDRRVLVVIGGKDFTYEDWREMNASERKVR